MNNEMYVSFLTLVSSGYMSRSEAAGSYGGFIPRFLRNLHTIFYSGCINLYSHQQCMKIPFSPHPHQHLLFVDFFNNGHSDWSEVISHYGFDMHFSNYERYQVSFLVCWLSVCLLWRNVCLGLLPIFDQMGFCFCFCFFWAACIFWRLILCQLLHLQIFSTIIKVVFLFYLGFPLLCKSS